MSVSTEGIKFPFARPSIGQRPKTIAQRAEPIALKGVSKAAVHWNNRIARCSHPLYFSLGEEHYRVWLEPWHTFQRSPTELVVKLSVAGETCWLFLNKWPADSKDLLFLPGNVLHSIPDGLRSAVAESVLAPLLSAAETLFGAKIAVLGLPTMKSVANPGLHVGFKLELRAGVSVNAAVACPTSLIPIVERGLERYPKPSSKPLDVLRYSARLEIGTAWLSVSEIQSLALDDVIFLQYSPYTKSSIVRTYFPRGLVVLLQHKGDHVVVEQVNEENQVEEEKGKPVNVDGLSLRLVFDIGQLTVSLSELKTIQPGHTFELDRSLGDLVHIYSNGQRIGMGELVQIEERAGVRVVELFGKKNG